MPVLSIWFIRTALIYLIIGFSFGGLLLFNKAYTISPELWQLLPVHYHILFIGWILQLVFGVAYWIMPRVKDSYKKNKLAWLCYILLNTGLITLISYYIVLFFNYPVKNLNLLGLLQIYSGIVLFIIYIWPRVMKVMIPKKDIA